MVNAVVEALELKNVTAHHTRVEEIKNRKFDTVVSRAVAPLGELWKWAKPLLSVKSKKHEAAPGELPVPHGLVCLKGGDLAAEISASGLRPRLMEISELFNEEFFKEKYILYVSS